LATNTACFRLIFPKLEHVFGGRIPLKKVTNRVSVSGANEKADVDQALDFVWRPDDVRDRLRNESVEELIA